MLKQSNPRRYCINNISSRIPILVVLNGVLAVVHQDPYQILQLLVVFNAEEALQLLQRVLEQQEVNWAAVLGFTGTLLVTYSEMAKLLMGMAL